MHKAKVVFSGYGDCSRELSFQHGVLLLLIGVSIPVGAIFSLINYAHGHVWLAMVLALVCLVLIVFIIIGFIDKWPTRSREILMLLAFIVFSSLFLDGGIANTGIYWALIFPFLAFLLMGIRLGWIWILIFIAVQAFFLILYTFGIIEFTYDHDTLRYTPAMYLFFTMVACSFQLQQEKRQHELNAVNRDLKISEELLLKAHENLEHVVEERTRELRRANERLSTEVDEKIEALQKMEYAEMKYQHAQKMESLGTLVGGIAHDFNNMLSGITANLFLIQRQVTNADAKERLEQIGDLTMHAADMIKQLMTFARKDDVKLKHFDLRAFFNEAFKLARVSIPEHIYCYSEFPEGELLIQGDATQIQQILMNLMNNARDALDGVGQPSMRVSLKRFRADAEFLKKYHDAGPGEYAILAVHDNGCGISRDKINRIFEPFYTTKSVGKGTGMGLAMIYGAVRTHGGFIDVQSQLGVGTEISIYLPLHGESSSAIKSDMSSRIVQGHGEVILLVDDDEILLKANKELLIKLGYHVYTACNGLEAVAAYKKRQEQIALVIMDVVMPVLGGAGAGERIHKLNPQAKIIFVTGYDKDNELTQEVLTEWHQMLNKPLVVEQLSQAIQKCLQN